MMMTLTSLENKKTHNKDVVKNKKTNKDVEIWEVAQLNSKIELCSKPSDIFNKLDEKRKIRHEKLIKELANDLNEVNFNIEENIKISSLEVKAHMKYYDDKLQDILKNIDKPEVASYYASVFLKYQNTACDFKLKQQKLVNELYDDLNRFENERAEENERLFHIAWERIRKNGYLLPYEVQTFVEHEIMKMNELSLNNRRSYDDLRLTLTLLTEQTFKSFVSKVFCVQEKWARYKIQEVYFNTQKKIEKKTAEPVPEAYTRLELKGQELIIHLTPDDPFSTCKFEEWSKNVEEGVSTIDTYAKKIIALYRKILEDVYQNFDNEMEEIRKEIEFLETLRFEERVIRPLLFEAQSDQFSEIYNLEIYWQNTLRDIRLEIKEAVEFISDACKLWERHAKRVCESKKLIFKALENLGAKNEEAFQELEIKLNIDLDSLRQETNENKLQKALEAVVTTLNSIKAKHESIYLSDVKIIEDFYKMMNLESDVLSAEIKEFIYDTHVIDNPKKTGYYSDFNQCLPAIKLIFINIQKCSQQIKSMKFWKHGVWAALETFSLKTKKFLESRAEIWIEKQIENLAEKMSVQVDFVEKRNERVRVNIYQKRKTEIDFHQSVFDQHKEAVKFNLKNMNENLENFTKKKLKEVDEIKYVLHEIENNAKLENRAKVIHSNQILINRKKEELEERLKFAYMRFRADCESTIFNIRQANIDFMKDIKLFHEGGNYSAEEGKMFATLLEIVDKEINNELKNLSKTLSKDENDIMKKCSTIFDPTAHLLTYLFEETLFYHNFEESLSHFKTEICNLAFTLKNDFDMLKNQTDCFCKLIRNIELPLKDDDYKFILQLLEYLYQIISNLFYPVSLHETSVFSMDAEEENEDENQTTNFSTKVTVSRTPTFRTTNLEDTLNYQYFKRNLFNGEDLPKNNGTFMANVSNNILKEMGILQNMGWNFYNKIQERKIIRQDLIPLNYETFASKVLLNLQYFNIQCEQLWLQTVLSFLPVLGRIKINANYYFKRKLNDYQTSTLNILEEFENSFLACIECQTLQTSKVLEELENKLLPLHGYYQNKGLLSELEEEVVRRTAALTTEWDSTIKKSKNQLRCFRIHHIDKRSDIEKIQNEYLKMKDKLFAENLGENLVDLILKYANRGGFGIARTSQQNIKISNEDSIIDNGEVPEEFKLKFHSSSEELHSVHVYFKQLIDLIEMEQIDISIDCSSSSRNSTPSLIRSNSYCKRKLNILLKPLDFNNIALEISHKLENRLRKFQTFITSKKNVHEETLLEWLKVWKFNVKKVQKLYTIKREEKAENSDITLKNGKYNNSSPFTRTMPSPLIQDKI